MGKWSWRRQRSEARPLVVRIEDDELRAKALKTMSDLKESLVTLREMQASDGPPSPAMDLLPRYSAAQVECGYSLGMSFGELESLSRLVPETVAATTVPMFNPATNGSPLLTVLNAASFVVLFEDRDGAAVLTGAVERLEVEDFFVDSFIGSLTDFREPSSTVQMDIIEDTLGVKRNTRLYAVLKEAAELALAGEADAAAERLFKYVNGQWLGRHKQAFAWDTTGWSEDYTGHWCFIGAATAKVFGIDDSALKGHKYYPWDLAHPES